MAQICGECQSRRSLPQRRVVSSAVPSAALSVKEQVESKITLALSNRVGNHEKNYQAVYGKM
ncbi:MAG: hypothetical protein AB4426_03170 [Xenococcaceae cyanobacterium]